MMAMGCYEVIKEAGLKIPGDFGVAGFDDIIISQYLAPPLTTVKVQIMEIGKQAANLLMNRMEGDHSKIKNIKISTELVIRNSC
jgi:LacI family transcriptional regulator